MYVETSSPARIFNRAGVFFVLSLSSLLQVAPEASASDVSVGLFGRPGTLDMPGASGAPEGSLAFTYTHANSFTRNSIFFQYAPWGSVTLRYGGNGAVGVNDVRPNYDRSLDFAFNVFPETGVFPSLSFGMQDTIGTGQYAGEYLVLGKTSQSGRLHVDLGLGWGRLASSGSVANPLGEIASSFKVRPRRDVGRGGRPYPQEWFKGDAAPFVGLTFKATDKLTLKAEYSSDDYSKSPWSGTLSSQSSYNFGAQYAFSKGVLGHVSYLQGTELAFGVTFLTNTRQSATVSARTPAPPYVFTGESGLTPAEYPETAATKETLNQMLDQQGLRVVGFDVDGSVARVAFENRIFDASAQAFGRMARWLTFALPPEVSTYSLTVVRSGMPLSTVNIERSALVSSEHELFGPENFEAASTLQAATSSINDFGGVELEQQFSWGLSPYALFTFFDPDEPRRADFGLQLDVHVTNGLGLEAAGSLRKRFAGNRDEGRGSNSALPHVRTDQVLYDQSDDVIIKDLYAAKYARLAPDLFGRVTVGYLEQMYAGLSAEALWAPFDSPWSFGLEANYVAQRDYDGLFGLRDYEVFTGHLSGQYTMSNGAYFQLATGQYLAGDRGATFTVGRTFKNGWDLSAYATLTDVPFDTFGEGSFDKGIRLEIPIAALMGTQTRDRSRIGIRSITRDGGARVQVPGQLSEMIEGYRRRDLQGTWSRIFR